MKLCLVMVQTTDNFFATSVRNTVTPKTLGDCDENCANFSCSDFSFLKKKEVKGDMFLISKYISAREEFIMIVKIFVKE